MDDNSLKEIEINTLVNALDSLETANSVLDRNDPLKWKWFAFAIHHSLYQFCCKSLHNSNYENLLKYGNTTDEGYLLKKGDSKNWLKSVKNKRNTDHPAYLIVWEKTDDKPPEETLKTSTGKNKKEKLIGFWSVLARVQDPIYWMGRLNGSKAISLSDNEWENVIWLTDELRNKIQHFIPKTYILVEDDFIKPGIDVVNIIERLVFETHTIFCPDEYKYRIQKSLKYLQSRLNA